MSDSTLISEITDLRAKLSRAEAALAELQVKYEALVPERDFAQAAQFCVEKELASEKSRREAQEPLCNREWVEAVEQNCREAQTKADSLARELEKSRQDAIQGRREDADMIGELRRELEAAKDNYANAAQYHREQLEAAQKRELAYKTRLEVIESGLVREKVALARQLQDSVAERDTLARELEALKIKEHEGYEAGLARALELEAEQKRCLRFQEIIDEQQRIIKQTFGGRN